MAVFEKHLLNTKRVYNFSTTFVRNIFVQRRFERDMIIDFIATFGAWFSMVLKLGRSGQQIINAWKVLKCGAGEGWRRSVGPIM